MNLVIKILVAFILPAIIVALVLWNMVRSPDNIIQPLTFTTSVFWGYAGLHLILFFVIAVYAWNKPFQLCLPKVLQPPPIMLMKYFKPDVQPWPRYMLELARFTFLTFIVSFFFGMGRNLNDLGSLQSITNLQLNFPDLLIKSVTASLIILITAEFSVLWNLNPSIPVAARNFVIISLGLDASALVVIFSMGISRIVNTLGTLPGFFDDVVYPIAAFWWISIVTSISGMYVAKSLNEFYDVKTSKILEKLGLGPPSVKRKD